MIIPGSWQRLARGAGLLDAHGEAIPTIFAEMSALAASTGAINLGQGAPDEDGPREVIEAARRAIADGRNQYPPGLGIQELRDAIAQHQDRWYGIRIDPDSQVLVTAGATEAIAAAILALTEEGDEVLVVEPHYDEYAAITALARARLVTVPVRAPSFLPDPDQIEAAVTDRTRIILLNTPHNPTGVLLPTEVMARIVEIAHRHDAIIISDEVYEHLVYDGTHVPIASLPGAFERTLTVSSGGKTFSVTGWKVGWISGPAALVRAVTAVKQFLTYVSAAPLQPAIALGLDLPDSVFVQAATTLRNKRDLLAAGLRAAGFELQLPAAGYFIVADAAPIGGNDAAVLARALPELVGVVAVPVTALVSQARTSEYASLLRFAFCKKSELLERAAAQLASLKLT